MTALPLTPPLTLRQALLLSTDRPVTAEFISEALWAWWVPCWGTCDIDIASDGTPLRFDLLGGATVARQEATRGWVATLAPVVSGNGPRQTHTSWMLQTERDVLAWLLMLHAYCDAYADLVG